MIKYIQSFFWDIEKPSMNPNSMSPIPKNRFINYARYKGNDSDSKEPNKTIWDYKKWEKEQGYKAQIIDLERLIDLLNH